MNVFIISVSNTLRKHPFAAEDVSHETVKEQAYLTLVRPQL